MRVYFVISACLVLGCTRANVDFNNGGGGSGGIGGGGSGGIGGGTGGNGGVDLGVDVGDLASLPPDDLARSPDLLLPVCVAGDRRCVSGPVASETCGGQWKVDRLCPYGSQYTKTGADCQNGYCAPPTTNGTTGCGNGGPLENVCSGPGNSGPAFSCQPFIIDAMNMTVEWWCAVAAVKGGGVAGDPCTKGADCHSGFCGSNGTCFWACQSTIDCPLLKAGHVTMPCTQITLRVEGQDVSVNSCTP